MLACFQRSVLYQRIHWAEYPRWTEGAVNKMMGQGVCLLSFVTFFSWPVEALPFSLYCPTGPGLDTQQEKGPSSTRNIGAAHLQ